MIGKDNVYIREGFKDTLFSELNIDEADNITPIKLKNLEIKFLN